MKAVTRQGGRDVRVEEVPDPRSEEPTGAVVRTTSTAVCGPVPVRGARPIPEAGRGASGITCVDRFV